MVTIRPWRSALALCILLLVSPVAAQTRVAYGHTARIEKSYQQVLAALLDYGNWCEKGCRYQSPGVVEDSKIKSTKDPDHFYTWTWIRDIKDTKYFSEVRVEKRSDSAIIRSHALTKTQKEQIEQFERETGRPHNALFDSSTNVISVRTLYDTAGEPSGTEVSFETSLTVSGFLALFPKKLQNGLKESTDAVFRALRK